MAFYQFPGSNFHDLNLDWLLQQMKNCLAEWTATKAEWETLSADNEAFKTRIEAEWDELRQFVTDYFNNLDVSQEISDKINAMAADGSLLALIESTVQTSTATAASAWLAEHVDPATGYVIDDTLSIQNAAADAKAVGDALDDTVHLTETALTHAEAALTLEKSEAVGVVAGGSGPINFFDGAEQGGTLSAHTDYIDISRYDAIIYSRAMSTTAQTSMNAGLAFYDSERTYIAGMPNHGGQTEQGYELFELPVPVGANYVRFTYYASSSLTDLTLRGVYKLYAKTTEAVNTRKETHNYYRWSQGTLDDMTGENATSSATCRTSSYVKFPSAENGIVTIHIADGYKIRVFEFDENKAFIRRYLPYKAGPTIDVRIDRSHWYRLTIAKSDGSTLSPVDVPDDSVWWEYQTSEHYRDAEASVTNAYPWWMFTVTINRAWPNTETTTSDNAETVDSHNVNCALVLPTTYTAAGSPTPLVMFGHGLGSSLSKNLWYGNNSNFLNLIRALQDAGYAVFDVDSSRGGSGGFADWGSLPLMESYIAAWDYIREHYNVSEKLFIFSDSMGTAASLNMLKWYPGRIATAVQTAPRPFSGPERYATDDDDDKKEILVAYGMEPDSILDDPTYVIPDVSVFDGLFSGFRNGTIAIDGVQYVPHQFPPIKVMVGQADTALLDETRTYYAALANSGNYVNYREVAGANHNVMCFLSQGGLTQEAINWFNRFRT